MNQDRTPILSVYDEKGNRIPIPTARGLTPYIGENGHWFIGKEDTGVSASGGISKASELTATVPTGLPSSTLGDTQSVMNATVVLSNEKQIHGDYAKVEDVADWAKVQLFNKNNLSGVGSSFIRLDGIDYFRYNANANNFKLTMPNIKSGSVKITGRAIKQYEGSANSRIIVRYTDGSEDIIGWSDGNIFTFETTVTKTVDYIRGNYDIENWILLDINVMSIIPMYEVSLDAQTISATDPTGIIQSGGNVQSVINSLKSYTDSTLREYASQVDTLIGGGIVG